MIKTATFTFHASHNYGSMLQAYALQKTIQKLGCDNEIVNLRLEAQKRVYPKPSFNIKKSLKSNFKCLILKILTKNQITSKYNKFEEFLKIDLKLTKDEYSSLKEFVSSEYNYDYYISGSDQIWNTICSDFDWSYFLPFAKNNGIAYAPSMGPRAKTQVSVENYGKIKDCLSNFKSVSVREQGTADVVEAITGSRPVVLVDPTMLISKAEWTEKISDKPLINEPYIFVYAPTNWQNVYNLAEKLTQLLGIKVVVSSLIGITDQLKYPSFVYKLDVGPWEFLNLISNASVILSGSFHAVVFSILLEKPFFAVNGMKDNRISNILELINLQDRSIDFSNVEEKSKIAYKISYNDKDAFLDREKERSINFLKNSMNL